MAIIYTYPRLTNPSNEDLLIVTDVTNNSTKSMRIGDIPASAIDVVDSFTNAFGTYITGTANANAKGDVDIGTLDLNAIDGTADSTTRFLSKDNTWDTPPAYSGGTNVGYVPTGSGNSAAVYLDGSGNWSTPPTTPTGVTSFNTLTGAVTISAGENITLTPTGQDIEISAAGSSLTVQDDTTPSYADISTINFIGGGVAVGNPSAGQANITVLPRLNHGFSPFPIYQGSNTIAVVAGSSLAIAGQTICDIAAGQLTITRVFGNLPEECIIKVAVYSGSLTFPSSTQLVYFGTTTVNATTVVNDIHTIDEPFDASAGNSWVPVAGTPITTVIEIDNSNGSTNAQLLGTLGAASLPSVFQTRLAFEVAPVAPATSVFDAAGTGNTVLNSSIQTIGNYAGRSVTSKRVCQHFDPDTT